MGGEGRRRKTCRLRRPTDTLGVDFTAYPDRQDNAASDYGVAPDRCSPGGEEREYGFYKQRWSPFFGQVVKLGLPDEKDGPDDGQAEAVWS